MKTNDKLEHPEINEMINICAIMPEGDGVKDVCDLIKATRVNTTGKSGKKSKKRTKIK